MCRSFIQIIDLDLVRMAYVSGSFGLINEMGLMGQVVTAEDEVLLLIWRKRTLVLVSWQVWRGISQSWSHNSILM
jgi:hypothetical protein